MRIYISGKITGLPLEEAQRSFKMAAEHLKRKYNAFNPEIVNPFDIAQKENPTWEDYMAEDIRELLKCDGIYMLKNWSESKGARIEYVIAQELNLSITYESDEPNQSI